MASLKETDLFPPLKTWLEAQGYRVRGEVRHCDVAAEKNGELIALELKLRPSLSLLAQAAERQEYADGVYAALPAAAGKPRPPSARSLYRLLRRLGIGLILVHFLKRGTRVEVVLHPEFRNRPPRFRPKRREAMLREISGRDLDLSPGGLPGGRARVSAYRQRCVCVAAGLEQLGQASPARLRALGAPEDCGTLLSRNVYGWFERVRRGVYRLHPAGRQALADVPELAALYRKKFSGTD